MEQQNGNIANVYSPAQQDKQQLTYAHEESMKDKDFQHEKDMKEKDFQHTKDMERLKLGWLGKLFGGSTMLPLNVAGIVVIILLVVGILSTVVIICTGVFCGEKVNTDTLKDIWSILTPIITLTIGYLFGKQTT
jgi:hypothetical protein